MLKTIPILTPEDKIKLFGQVSISKENISRATWVVSDLTSKLSFQKELFKKQSLIEDESLLRAHELWTKLITRLRPDLKIISQDAAGIFIQQFLENSDLEWTKRPGVPSLVLQYTQALLPVLSHPENHEVVKEFFQKNINSFQRWGHWYLISYDIYHYLIKEKMILSSWISAVLLYEDLQNLKWERAFYFDLGSQLLPVEAELIMALSKSFDVTVVAPDESWSKEYSKSLKAYDVFFEKKTLNTDPNVDDDTIVDYIKVSTCLGEVQHACSLIRKILEQNLAAPPEIAITAPDISVYWPCIKEYFNVEGVPLNRNCVSNYLSFPEFQQWLAQLKLLSGEAEKIFVELALSDGNDFPLRHEKFNSIFANIYSQGDFSRTHLEISRWDDGVNMQSLNIDSFLKYTLRFWKDSWSIDKLKVVIEKIYGEFSRTYEFSFKTWVEIFEKKISKLEVIVQVGAESGLEVVDLISLKDLRLKYVFVLGLTDRNLRSNSKILISEFDSDFLKQNYGYLISDSENNNLEFELAWNLRNENRKNYLFFPQSDFEGSAQAPSHIWLRGAVKKYNTNLSLTIPDITRLKEIQHQTLDEVSDIKKWSQEYKVNLGSQFQKDSGHEDYKITGMEIESLSASQIEDYLKCPFIHQAKKLYSLYDLPDLDLDIDYQTRGQLLHGLAEEAYKVYPDLNIDPLSVSKLFDDVVQRLQISIVDPAIWQSQKNKYLKIFNKFLDNEREWKKEFPDINQKYLEQELCVYLDPQTLEVSIFKKMGSILLRGRMDRLDVDQEGKACVVIDYKFDSKSFNNWDKWIEKNQIQLALYSYIIEAGGLDKKLDVLGAVYYGFKNLNRHKGFLLEEADGYMYTVGAKRSKISALKKEELFAQLKNKIIGVIANMSSGNYQPKPSEESLCIDCSWRAICRAPHLN